MGILHQFLGTVIVCGAGVNLGLVYAWPAFTISLFHSPNTTLDRPMTDMEISLFGSLASVGALIATPTAGYMLDKLGRKKCVIFNSLGIVMVWTTLTFTRKVEVVLTALFFSGIASPVFLITSAFITEICQESIRGAMTSVSLVSFGLGMLLSYLLGGLLQYDAMLYVCLSVSVVGACLLLLLKETPLYLMLKGRDTEAMKSLAHYRGLKLDSKELLTIFNTIKHSLNTESKDETPEEETLQPEKQPAKKPSVWQFIKKSKSSQRAFLVVLMVMTAAMFQGLVAVQIYAEVLFRDIIPSMSPSLCSVLLAVSTVSGNLVAAFLTDWLGRRPLMIYASAGSGISCLILGTQMQFHWGPSWVAATFIYVFPVMYTLGAGTVPFVLLAEVFLPEIKSLFSMILVEYVWLCNFVLLFIINSLVTNLGWGPVFYIFSSVGFTTAVFCFFFLPETKGQTVESIQSLFMKKRKVPDFA